MSEQAFRNVTVLKGIPVDEFMATMGFISAATNYNCISRRLQTSLSLFRSLPTVAQSAKVTCARRALSLRLYRTGMVSAGGEGFSQVVRRQEEVDCLCLPA
jgi:hypothetical protein